MPKIWIDLATELLGEDLLEVAGDPDRALEITARAAAALGLDGARIFHLPPRRLARDSEGQAVELDAGGRVIGRVDEPGGLATILEDGRTFDLRDPTRTVAPQFWCSGEPFVRDLADARSVALPDEAFWEESGQKARARRVVSAWADKVALAGDLGSATVSFCASLRGVERTMFDLVDNPALVHALMDKGAQIAVEKARLNLGLGLRILRLNDSAGTMSLISPAMWREFVLPRFRAIRAAVRAMDSGALVYCHICGDLRPIAADLVEAGIDCLGPLDPLGGSTPEALRAIVGEGKGLMGGVDTLTFLRGSAAEVVREALARVLAGGRRGGFTLGSGCVVPRGTPRANIEAARDLARSTAYEGGELRFTDSDRKETA